MPCRIIEGLDEVSDRYDAVLCDVWGCYHDGISPFPAAVAALRAFRNNGGIVVLLTNAPRTGESVRRQLDEMGAPHDSYDAIVSSGGACQAALASGRFGANFHYVGPDRDNLMMTEIGLTPVPLEDASAILLTGLRDDWNEDLEDYADEIGDWAEMGIPLLCANPDIEVDRGERRFWCAGALAREYERLGGEVVYFGKPHLPVYDRCHEVLSDLAGREISRNRILSIGDGILTDVPGGIRAGLDTLFVTGGLAAGALGPDPERPDPALLEKFLGKEGLEPTFAIGRLR